ncbi:hypothetical protein AVEN_9529-1 [Araneus ventricosus]|uniref:Uncharacterized protein n=1 Tax=Araneus ventricosus TaxID=182803 RepID=A0A4Y2LSS1_ARAVE|nr:hypothetical protein AVEN_9529-1 [Araneus ventricosus]
MFPFCFTFRLADRDFLLPLAKQASALLQPKGERLIVKVDQWSSGSPAVGPKPRRLCDFRRVLGMLSKGRERDLVHAAAGHRTLTTGGSSHGRRTIHLLTACLVNGTGLRLTGAVHCPRWKGSSQQGRK